MDPWSPSHLRNGIIYICIYVILYIYKYIICVCDSVCVSPAAVRVNSPMLSCNIDMSSLIQDHLEIRVIILSYYSAPLLIYSFWQQWPFSRPLTLSAL